MDRYFVAQANSGRWLAVVTVGQQLIEGSISFRCFNISWILFFYIRFCVQGFFGNIGNRNQVKWFYVPWVQPPITMLSHISLDLFIKKLLIFLSVMSRLKIMQVFFLRLQWNLSSIVLFEFFRLRGQFIQFPTLNEGWSSQNSETHFKIWDQIDHPFQV